MADRESVVRLWVRHTCRGSQGLLAAVAYLQKRKTVPIRFSNRRSMIDCLSGVPGVDLDDAWASYLAYQDRFDGKRDTLPTSWAEATRLGLTRFEGEPCRKDPSHGNIRGTTKSRPCVKCRSQAAKEWTKRARVLRRDPYAGATEGRPYSDEELAQASVFLEKSRRRA